jgi:RimJ/RimL family protein N-acetyltransferase
MEAAENYILTGPLRSYTDNGFGLWAFTLKTDKTPIGICGLIKREGLPDIDIGFAMLPEYENNGYAFEIASATLKYGHRKLHIDRIVAITTSENKQSIKLLNKIGLHFEKMINLPNDNKQLMLFGNWKIPVVRNILSK